MYFNNSLDWIAGNLKSRNCHRISADSSGYRTSNGCCEVKFKIWMRLKSTMFFPDIQGLSRTDGLVNRRMEARECMWLAGAIKSFNETQHTNYKTNWRAYKNIQLNKTRRSIWGSDCMTLILLVSLSTLIVLWLIYNLERWRLTALDKLAPDGRTDIVTPWAPVGAKNDWLRQ